MTDNEIIKALDGADVFLRDRARSKPSPLNEYDIALLLDIAKTCDEAAAIINRQKAEIERLQKRIVNWREDMDYRPEKVRTDAIREFRDALFPRDLPRRR